MVYDSINNAGGVMEVAIDKWMLQYVHGARSRYEEAITASKAARERATEIKDLEAKKAKLAGDATSAVLSLELEIKELKKLN